MMRSGLKVCIDCAPLLVRSAGVKTYIHHWLRVLRDCEPESISTFLEPRHGDLNHASGANRHFLRLAKLWTLNRVGGSLASRFVPACSVFHQSNLVRWRAAGPRLSATIHDLTTWIVPHCHTSQQRQADEAFANGVLQSADGLICVSENSRRDAERILRLDRRKMTVIWPGVAEPYFRAGPREAAAAAAALGLGGPYFLFASTIEPRKNLDGLLDAWLSLSSEFRQHYRLLVAGMQGWRAEATLRRLRQIADEERGVRYLGYVDEALMAGLTTGARALVYPSFYEGFGIPVAQALAAGCPVIASGVSSLPEVVGDAGLLADPRSPGEFADAIKRIGAATNSVSLTVCECFVTK
jgi:alpha-1,3-rhamnosyl/mannosyltransferase